MSDILTYLDWRGDIELWERPFNEIDNLVLSLFSYIDFSGIMAPDCSESLTVADWHEKLICSGGTISAKAFDRPGYFDSLWSKMAVSARFGGARISNFSEIHDEERQIQFAALHIGLADGTTYVAFRGTDQTICGWRESFAMSFEIVPAQVEAVEYVNRTLQEGGHYRLGGHSKGGNLALYAAVMCRAGLKPLIVQVYSNDGPGLSPDILQAGGYVDIKDRVVRIIPEYSIVGMLFGTFEAGRQFIVKSSEEGPFQHAGDTWQVEGGGFVMADRVSPDCMELNGIIDEWLEDVGPKQRKVFIRDLFDALEAGGAKNLDEVGNKGAQGFEAVLRTLAGAQADTKTTFKQLAKTFWKHIRPADLLDLLGTRPLARGAVLLLMGLCTAKLPAAAAMPVASVAIILVVLVLSRRALRYLREKNHWRHMRWFTLVLCCALPAILTLLALHGGTALFGAYFATGTLCCLYGYWNLYRCLRWKGRRGPAFAAASLRAGLASLLGLAVIVARGSWLEAFVLAAGIFLLLDGAIEIILAAIRKYRRIRTG